MGLTVILVIHVGAGVVIVVVIMVTCGSGIMILMIPLFNNLLYIQYRRCGCEIMRQYICDVASETLC